MSTSAPISAERSESQASSAGAHSLHPVVGRVLVACEFSGVVRDAFARRGWYAKSCDLLASETPGEHYQGDVRDILSEGLTMAQLCGISVA